MTVTSEVSSVFYYGNTANPQEFTVPFYFISSSDLNLVKTLADGSATVHLIEDTDYTVNGAGNQSGGTITMINTGVTNDHTVLSAEKLVIERTLPVTQELDYITGGKFRAETHERGLDRIIMIVQQILRAGVNLTGMSHGLLGDLGIAEAGHTWQSKTLANMEPISLYTKINNTTSILEFIPSSEHEAILDGTTTYDVSDDCVRAFTSLPPGSVLELPAHGKLLFRSSCIISDTHDITLDGNRCVITFPDDLVVLCTDSVFTIFNFTHCSKIRFVNLVVDGNADGLATPYTFFRAEEDSLSTGFVYFMFYMSPNCSLFNCEFFNLLDFGVAAYSEDFTASFCYFHDSDTHNRLHDVALRKYKGGGSNSVDSLSMNAVGVSFWQSNKYEILIDLSGDTFTVTRLSASSFSFVSSTPEVIATGVPISEYINSVFPFDGVHLLTGLSEGEWMIERTMFTHADSFPTIQFSSDITYTPGDSWTFFWRDLRVRHAFLGGPVWSDPVTGDTATSDRLSITDCKFIDAGRGNAQHGCTDFIFSRNLDIRSQNAVYQEGTDPVRSIITNNRFVDMLENCVEINSRNFVITGNIFERSVTTPILVSHAKDADGGFGVISDNIFEDCATRNLQDYSLRSVLNADIRIGVSATNGVFNLQIKNNLFYHTGGIDLSNKLCHVSLGTNNPPPQLAGLSIFGNLSNVGIPLCSSDILSEVANVQVGSLTFESVLDNGDSGAAVTIYLNLGQKQKINISEDTVITFVSPKKGVGDFRVTITNPNQYSITWPVTGVKWPGGALPSLSVNDILSIYWDGTSFNCLLVAFN